METWNKSFYTRLRDLFFQCFKNCNDCIEMNKRKSDESFVLLTVEDTKQVF